MDTCSRCGGKHYNLDCLYRKVKIQSFNSNIDLQTSKSQS